MDTKLQDICDLFVKNSNVFKDTFKWEFGSMCLVGGVLFASKGKEVTSEELVESEHILNEEEGFFSEFRGIIKVAVVSAMALSGDPRTYIKNVNAIYKKIKAGKILSSEQQALAAMLIYENKKDDYDPYVLKLKELFDLHNNKHPFLTDENDLSILATCALSEIDAQKLFDDAEECFNIIKEKYSQNAAQSLAMVLSMYDDTPKNKCDKTFELINLLTEKDIKLAKEWSLATIGMLAMSSCDFNDISTKIKDVDNYISKQSGFGPTSLPVTTRTMFATLLVSSINDGKLAKIQTSVLSSTLTEIIIINLLLLVIVINNTNRMVTTH